MPPRTHKKENPPEPTKRVAVAIEMEYALPWHYGCCEGILNYGKSQGWSCTLDPLLLDYGVDGEADRYDGIVGRIGPEVAEAARAQGIPVVNHWTTSPVKDLPSVLADAEAGAQMVGEHLVTCGYRSLGYIDSQTDSVIARSILKGLSRVASEVGLAPPVVHLCDPEEVYLSSRESYVRFQDELADALARIKAPAGLFIGHPALARYLLQCAKRMGLSSPEDVGTVVWHDEASTTMRPSLSALEEDYFKVGYEAAAMLDELMQGKDVQPKRRMIAPVRVVRRDTTDVFLCDDELVKEAMQYIATHCRQELKIQDVADALLVSDRTLYRKFDEVLGRSIKDEIKRLRTEQLKLVVERTDQKLSQIAHAFGFSTPGQFSRYFSRSVGMTPSEYRKKFAPRTEEG